MLCQKCGFQLSSESKFCPGCGSKVKKGANKAIIALIISIVLLLLISASVFAFLYFNSESRDDSKSDRESRKEKEVNDDYNEKPSRNKKETSESKDDDESEISIAVADTYKIGISMPTKDLQRWREDGEKLKIQLEKMGYEVDLQYAGNDIAAQCSQIDKMINDGVNILVVAAVDGYTVGEAVDKAKDAGIVVISYDRLIMRTDAVSYYVTFDNYMVGVLQAEYIVDKLNLDNSSQTFNIEITTGDPGDSNAALFYDGAMDILSKYINEGKLNVVSGQIAFNEVTTNAWSTENAYYRAQDIISKYYADGTSIDVWLCSNDSTASGVIEALKQNYSGYYPIITGQDCDIVNVRYILSGFQSMSVFKLTSDIVDRVCIMINQISEGKKVETNDDSRYNNGAKSVKSYLCAPVVVDANNYRKYLIDTGYYSEDDIR